MQEELFKEFEATKKKRQRKSSHNILPKNYVLFHVSYEQIIFLSIAVIMLMVLLFSLGVERGKHLSRRPAQQKRAVEVETVKELVAAEKTETPKSETKEAVSSREKTTDKKVADSKLFTIQIVAYRSKRSAQKELIRLGKKGHSPFIIVGGGYYQICVGEYESHEAAEKDYNELRKTYKDSFIRKR